MERRRGWWGAGPGHHLAECPAPQVSFVVRIVPSPDWFVGVDSLDLCDGDHWREQVAVDLYPYDAGTDSGFTFSSPNFATIPQDTVTEVRGQRPRARTGSGPLGDACDDTTHLGCLAPSPVWKTPLFVISTEQGVQSLPRRELAALWEESREAPHYWSGSQAVGPVPHGPLGAQEPAPEVGRLSGWCCP